MRKAIIGWAVGVGLLFGVGCNPPPNATPNRTLGPSQATLNTFPGVVSPSKVAQRASPSTMRGTGGSGAAGTAAFGPSEPLGETPADASRVNYANQGGVVGGAGNAADAYSTAEPSTTSLQGAALEPKRGMASAPPAPQLKQRGQLKQQRGKKLRTQKPRAKRQRAP